MGEIAGKSIKVKVTISVGVFNLTGYADLIK